MRVFPHGARGGAAKCNCLAGLICLAAIAIVLLNFKATPAGAGANTAKALLKDVPVSRVPAGKAAGEGTGSIDAGSLHSAIRGSRVALLLHIAQLELGLQRLSACPTYTCKFTKQERITDDDDLHEPQTMALKVRHAPFSVYMKWEEGGDVGREVLFCENQYENKLLVKLGGIRRALPTIKLEPTSSMAMAEARHPITQAGLKYLVEQAIKFRRRDLSLKSGVTWELISDQEFDGRPCDCFITQYESPSVEPAYRKHILYIDRELSLPVCARNYGWPQNCDTSDPQRLDEQSLIEVYAYTSIQLVPELTDADFDKTNTAYKFKR